MAINLTNFTKDVKNIQGLSDKPNETDGLTAQGLKEKFDKAGEDIKNYLNGTLITELEKNLTSLDTKEKELESKDAVHDADISNINRNIDLINSALVDKEKRTEHSTIEQNTGKKNSLGKDIYAIDIVVTCGSGTQVIYDLPTHTSICDIKGMVNISDSWLPVNYIYVVSEKIFFISTSTYNGKMYLRNSVEYAGATGIVTIEYTKD